MKFQDDIKEKEHALYILLSNTQKISTDTLLLRVSLVTLAFSNVHTQFYIDNFACMEWNTIL